MSYLNQHIFDLGADSQEDAKISVESLKRKAEQIQNRIDQCGITDYEDLNNLKLQLGEILVDLNLSKDAWNCLFPTFNSRIQHQQWEQAVVVCDTLFRSGHDDALIALGHSLWLSITFPVDVTLTLSQLQHVIDETPEDSDGAAVAAAVAAYVADLRITPETESNTKSDSTLAVGKMLNEVSHRHGNVQTQDEFNSWFEKLELNRPDKFLVRMRNIIDVLVQGQWWIDRPALQALIPEN